MTKTEAIVRILKSALAGTSNVSINGKFEEFFHSPVPIKIDGNLITFWKRTALRRIQQVTFEDGTTIDTEGFEAERWVPPKAEFPDWHEMMNVFENASDEELEAALKNAGAALTAAIETREKTDEQHPADYKHALENFNRCNLERSFAFERMHAYEPFHYLSDSDQDRLEEILKTL
jgi:hypothetical protein